MRKPILRATSESGETLNDPSEDALFELLSDVEAAMNNSRLCRPWRIRTLGQVCHSTVEASHLWPEEAACRDARQHFAELAAAHAGT